MIGANNKTRVLSFSSLIVSFDQYMLVKPSNLSGDLNLSYLTISVIEAK